MEPQAKRGANVHCHEFVTKSVQHIRVYRRIALNQPPGVAYDALGNLKLLDSYWSLILPYMTSAFCIFNMRQAYMSLPSELNEAAKIDGCNSFQFMMYVGIPLTFPFLGALGIYTFLQVWNQYLWPMLVTNKIELRTVQIGIGMLQNSDAMAYGPVMAGTTLILIPSILVFVLGQKSLISGLTAGAVKG